MKPSDVGSTDLDLLYELSDELSYHLQRVILHAHQARQLLELSAPVFEGRFTDDGAVVLHGDHDNRALVEMALFPVFWSEIWSQVQQIVEEALERLDSLAPTEFVVNASDPVPPKWFAASVYPEVWRLHGIQLLQRMQHDLPARRILAHYYGTNRAIEQVYELYQTEAYPFVFHAGAVDESPSEAENGTPFQDYQDYEDTQDSDSEDPEDRDSL